MNTDILNLPFEIQLILASGYLSYKISSASLNKNHRTIDEIFQILSFGMIAYITNNLIRNNVPSWNDWQSMPIATASSLLTAIFWRKWIWDLIKKILKKSGTTNENFYPSSWDHIICHKDILWRYIIVQLKDGYMLESDLDQVPKHLPFRPLDVDSSGAIALYITSLTRPNQETAVEFGYQRIHDEIGCSQITYIPASEISRIDIRFSQKGKATD